MNNPFTRILLVVAVLVALVAGGWLLNARSIAGEDAQSLCTNLTNHRNDIGATSYDVEAAILGYEADLLELGYVCDNGKPIRVTVIEVTKEMEPSATDPTCEADGELVLPEVEHATWQMLFGDEWKPVAETSGPGTYKVRLTTAKRYALRSPVEREVTVEPKLTGETCVAPPQEDDTYTCRTNGPNGGPAFLAFEPDKLGPYSYGPPFMATTVEEARQSIYDQSWCDPVWMVQKYREYVDYTMTPEQAHAKVLELIEQAKAGDHAQWDKMVNEIIAQFDRAKHEFTTIDPGEYHSLGMLNNAPDGIPRVVDHVIYDSGRAHVLRSTVTYPDGTVRVLDLRTACNLQLRTPVAETPTGPAVAPPMAQVRRDVEARPVARQEQSPPTPATETTTPAEPSASPSTSPSPSPSASTETLEPCPPINGQIPPRNPDGSCPKENAGPNAPAQHEGASAPAAGQQEETAAVESAPASTATGTDASAPGAIAPGTDSGSTEDGAGADTVDPDPTTPADGDTDPDGG